MFKKTLYVSIFVFFITHNVFAAGLITQGDVLNLERCINIALQNHPSINAASSTVRVSESKIGQARANYFPQITFESSSQRGGPASLTSVKVDPYNQYTNTLNLSQNLFDFGKTFNQIQIQSLGTESARADLQDVSGQVVLGVKQAYYGFLQTKMSRNVAMETLNPFQQHQ